MKLALWLALVLGIATPCFGETSTITKVMFPEEVKMEARRAIEPDLQALNWNRWTSQNFVVCSLNDQQAQFLHAHLEAVKEWSLKRWGLQNINFPAECILLCVDDREMFKKFFSLDASKVEIRRDASGKITRSVIFLLCDTTPSEAVPVPVTEVCLSNYEQVNNVRLGWWAHRGISLLNGSLPSIRKSMADLHPLVVQDQPMFFSKALFTATQEQLIQMPDKQGVFDKNSVAACLMLRKEFGQDKFLEFLKTASDPEAGLRGIYHFTDYTQFDQTFKRFMFDLSSDITGARPDRPPTPDSYLQIREKVLSE